MPLTLNNPKVVNQVVITEIRIWPQSKQVTIILDNGDGATLSGSDVAGLMAAKPQKGETMYAFIKRVCYQALQDARPELQGTVE